MIEEIKNIPSGKKDLRKFGMTMGIAFAFLAGLLLWRGKETYVIFLVLAGLFLLSGLILPLLLKPIYKVWMTFAVIMGWIMTRVILGLLFYLTVTPIGVTGRLFGKDFLDKTFERNSRGTYWLKKEARDRKQKDYERQY